MLASGPNHLALSVQMHHRTEADEDFLDDHRFHRPGRFELRARQKQVADTELLDRLRTFRRQEGSAGREADAVASL